MKLRLLLKPPVKVRVISSRALIKMLRAIQARDEAGDRK